MTGQDLRIEIQQKLSLMDRALIEAKDRGIEQARAEQAYQVAKMQETLKLKAEGTPVTIINNIVKGLVAEQLFKRDSALVLYNSAKEAINVYKIAIKALQEDYNREWSANK